MRGLIRVPETNSVGCFHVCVSVFTPSVQK